MGGLSLTDLIPAADQLPVALGHSDPAGEPPWAMQLVTRLERAAVPSRAGLCAAAAIAVVRLLADERSAPGGPWEPSVRRWTRGRIRKHARRARGVAWERVQALDGVTVDLGGAQVRALVPTSLGDLPREVARLQLSGSELDVVGPAVLEPLPGGPLVIPLGKAVAAAGHAAQLAWLSLPAGRRSEWAEAGYPVEVEHPEPQRWRRLLERAPIKVIDGGLTVVAPGTCTAVVRWS